MIIYSYRLYNYRIVIIFYISFKTNFQNTVTNGAVIHINLNKSLFTLIIQMTHYIHINCELLDYIL
jgi:hypothetical protein